MSYITLSPNSQLCRWESLYLAGGNDCHNLSFVLSFISARGLLLMWMHFFVIDKISLLAKFHKDSSL